jgi:hypothetical protein
MKLACNIDAEGKASRLRAGIVEVALAALLTLAWALPARSTIGWIVAGVLLLAGRSRCSRRAPDGAWSARSTFTRAVDRSLEHAWLARRRIFQSVAIDVIHGDASAHAIESHGFTRPRA